MEKSNIKLIEKNEFADSRESLTRQQRLGQAIGVLVSSYAKAINKQEERAGSLIRSKTKAEDGIGNGRFTDYGPKSLYFAEPPTFYWQTCFNYIHQNPVKAEMVDAAEDWPYSSASDYLGDHIDSICNLELAMEIALDTRYLKVPCI